jgi:hypothetical protein
LSFLIPEDALPFILELNEVSFFIIGVLKKRNDVGIKVGQRIGEGDAGEEVQKLA